MKLQVVEQIDNWLDWQCQLPDSSHPYRRIAAAIVLRAYLDLYLGRECDLNQLGRRCARDPETGAELHSCYEGAKRFFYSDWANTLLEFLGLNITLVRRHLRELGA